MYPHKEGYIFRNCLDNLLKVGVITCIVPYDLVFISPPATQGLDDESHEEFAKTRLLSICDGLKYLQKSLCKIVHILAMCLNTFILLIALTTINLVQVREKSFRVANGIFKCGVNFALVYNMRSMKERMKLMKLLKTYEIRPRHLLHCWEYVALCIFFGFFPLAISCMDNFEKYIGFIQNPLELGVWFLDILLSPFPFYQRISQSNDTDLIIATLGISIPITSYSLLIIDEFNQWIMYFSIFFILCASIGIYEINSRISHQNSTGDFTTNSVSQDFNRMFYNHKKLIGQIGDINSVFSFLTPFVYFRQFGEFCGILIYVTSVPWYMKVLILRQSLMFALIIFTAAQGYHIGCKFKSQLLLKHVKLKEMSLDAFDIADIKNTSSIGLIGGKDFFVVSKPFIGMQLSVGLTFVVVVLQFIAENYRKHNDIY